MRALNCILFAFALLATGCDNDAESLRETQRRDIVASPNQQRHIPTPAGMYERLNPPKREEKRQPTPPSHTDEPVTIRFICPRQPDALPSSAAKWGVAAPVEKGYADPNQIVYDAPHAHKYLHWRFRGVIACGMGTYLLATPDDLLEIRAGIDWSYLGGRFESDDLLRFLELRVNGDRIERTITVDDPDLKASLLRARSHPVSPVVSPWERDTRTVMAILGKARFAPAYPLLVQLLEDESRYIQMGAIQALSNLAPRKPEAVAHIARFIGHEDRELFSVAADNLGFAGGVAVPTIIKLLDHSDWLVRSSAVHALGRMYPIDEAVPGFLSAIEHSDVQVRRMACRSVSQRLRDAKPGVGDPLIDALIKRREDDDRDVRRYAAQALEAIWRNRSRAASHEID